jgi:hypothetical protein
VLEPADLVAVWSLDRQLLDARNGASGSVVGTLEIAPDGPEFTWFERGSFKWGGVARPATRSLRLVRIDGAWWCTFADGGLFHPWRPGSAVEHPCRADLYRGRIDIEPPDEMRMSWAVTGPDKDHRYDTVFRRLPA